MNNIMNKDKQVKRFFHLSVGKVVVFALLGFLLLITAYPVFWMIVSAMKQTQEFYVSPWALPKQWQFNNFIKAFVEGKFAGYFYNSIKITFLSVTVMIFLASMASYGIVRNGGSWSNPLLFFFLAGQMIPAQVVIIPLFLQLNWLGFINSHLALVCTYTGSGLAFTTFLLQGFFRGIPKELYDATRIDGAGEWQTFWSISLPLVKSGISAAIIFQSLWVWNEFLLALIVLPGRAKRTLPVALWRVVEGWVPRYNLAFSALTIVTIPVIIVFIINQQRFEQGLVQGAVKG